MGGAFPTYGADEPLSDGQWFHVGLSGVVGGYYFDHARSVSIGDPTPQQIEAYEATIAAVQAGIAAIVPGATASDVAIAGRRALEARGFELEGRFQGFGHGIGLGWDAPWLIPNDHTPLVPGMVLCVEAYIGAVGGRHGVKLENQVLITETGSENLTRCPFDQRLLA